MRTVPVFWGTGTLYHKDLKHIDRLADKYTFNDVHFEAFFKSAYAPYVVIFTVSIKECFERGDFLLCNNVDLN